MHAVEPMLEAARPHYATEPDLNRTILNSTSWVEANLAIDLLAETTPSRALVTIANVREAIKELPRCPTAMSIDFEGLARTWSLEREGMAAWARSFKDPVGDYTILLLGDGNFLYDIVIRTDGRTLMWMPRNSEENFLNPEVVDLIIERPTVLGTVVDLVQAMGRPFYPTFYMSLEDWRQEYMQTVFEEVVDLFSTTEAPRGRAEVAEEPRRSKRRSRKGPGAGEGLSWT